MTLEELQKLYLARRWRLVRTWPLVGASLLAVIVAALVWLFYQAPMFVNPFTVMSRMEANAIEASTLGLMAGMLPVVVWMCFLLLFILIVFAFTAFSREKKLLRIIDALSAQGGRS